MRSSRLLIDRLFRLVARNARTLLRVDRDESRRSVDPKAIGAIVFACTFGGVLVGVGLRAVLPDHHVNYASRDTVKLGIGLIATMSALILGLVTASAKSSFDSMDTAVEHTAADILTLDRVLARYGPETEEIRLALKQALARKIDLLWPQGSSRASQLDPAEASRGVEELVDRIRALSARPCPSSFSRSSCSG